MVGKAVKPGRRVLWLALAAGVATALFLLVPQLPDNDTGGRDRPLVPAAGDPATAQPRAPEQEPVTDLPGSADDPQQSRPEGSGSNRGDREKTISDRLTHSHQGLVAEPVAGGGEKVNLKGRFGSAPVARRRPDGTIVIDHYRSEAAPED